MKKYFGSPTRVWVNCPSFLSCYNHLHGRVGIALTVGDRDGKHDTTLYFNSGSIRSILIDSIYLESKNSQEDILMLNKEYPKTMEKLRKTDGFNIKIDIPEGFEIDHEKSSFSKIVFKKKKVKELPKSWEELNYVCGNFVANDANVVLSQESCSTISENKNIFRYPWQAKASVALAQLSQLREVYRDGWKPDWINEFEIKYCIIQYGKDLTASDTIKRSSFLSFRDMNTAKLFLKNFKELIKEASPLLFE